MMKTITAYDAQNDLFQLVRETVKEYRQYRIVSEDGDAVLLSEEEYESLLETLALLSTPGFKESVAQAVEDIARGETFSMAEIFGAE
jgi:antitoxin YefM